MAVGELRRLYVSLREELDERLSDFKRVPEMGLEKVFEELCFCLLTPQSRARAADAAVRELRERGLLFRGGWREVARVLRRHGVRFPEVKARRIVAAREHLKSSLLSKVLEAAHRDPAKARRILVENVKGLGYKEASHFLRNIGFRGLAILDRHILRTLKELGALDEVPRSLNERTYLELEKVFLRVAEELQIPPDALDLLMWARKTGEVFK